MKTIMKAIALSLAISFFAAPMHAATAKLWSSGTYEYDGAGNVTAIGADTYAYDSAGRLLAATVERQRGYMNGAQAYGYDPFGNLTAADSTAALRCAGGVSCGGVVRVDPNTNRIAPDLATYDDAGNLTSDGVGYEYRYDPLGMMKSQKAQTVQRQFVYTADGERIAVYSAGAWNWTLRDLGGKPLRTFASGADPAASPWTWNEDYIYRGTSLVATEDAAAGRRHVHLDHLGTPRLITDDKAAVIGHHAYLPFGTELDLAPRENPEILLKFTSHERDTIPGDIHTLDYMHARYYSAAMGRFTTVDPSWESADVSRPQSWNRYAYVENDPINKIDPDGRNWVGALIGGAIGVGAESIRQIRSGEPVDNRRLFAALTGGVVAGATGGIGGATFRGAVASGAGGSILGGAVERGINKDEKIVDGKAIVIDGISGGVGGAAGQKLGQTIVRTSQTSGQLNRLSNQAAVQRAEAAAANTGQGADRETVRQADKLVRGLTGAGDVGGNVVGEQVKNELNKQADKQKRKEEEELKRAQ
jgi:RHS repeat-associated protein